MVDRREFHDHKRRRTGENTWVSNTPPDCLRDQNVETRGVTYGSRAGGWCDSSDRRSVSRRSFHRDDFRARPERRSSRSSLNHSHLYDNSTRSETREDSEGHIIFKKGQVLGGRYEITKQEPLGEGTFGKVLECRSLSSGRPVAIKVVRNVRKYRTAAITEADTLCRLHSYRHRGMSHVLQTGRRGCVSLLDQFDHYGHTCLVFDILGPSLYSFLEDNDFKGFHISFVKCFSWQLLASIAYSHEVRLCHTDLKPENILLEHCDWQYVSGRKEPKGSNIVVIDFGSATFENEHHSSVVSTRHYRAPEVMLGMGWSYPCDLWSIGCIILELFTGETLFQTHSNLEHMAMMERALGRPLPRHFSRHCNSHARKYFKGERLNWPEGADDDDSVKAVNEVRPIEAMLEKADPSFLSLILGLLEFDPARRLTAREALNHRFFDAC